MQNLKMSKVIHRRTILESNEKIYVPVTRGLNKKSLIQHNQSQDSKQKELITRFTMATRRNENQESSFNSFLSLRAKSKLRASRLE